MVTKLWSLGRVKLLTNNGDRLVVRSPEKTALYHCFKRVRNWLGSPEFLKGRGHIGDTIRCFLLLLLERHPVRRHGGPERRTLPRLRAVEENAQNWCLKMTETIVPSSLGLLTRTAAPPWGRPWLRDVRECSCLLRRHQQAKQP